ncbi:lysosomal Pro-X carboxypeptidase-like [Actinia tenebrosa]|uniref:Lysosomal Pro-X carboxypeptidase n=1 Tax=Actinia tenebrosa TaxID=6105 RepID=A0A6P8ITM8_ACTTE|nr:lysosomal Pro-X carboxypeptidase-like [Actinia tenebrosa]
MAVYRVLIVVFVLFLTSSFGESFRLKARFPNQRTSDHEIAAKKTICPYCKYETKYYEQKLDHFNFEKNETFQQRYLVNRKQWKTGGPIFFYTGNEGDITWFANNTGFMWDNAEEFGAMLVFGEHRYYGETLPFGKKSYESPKYLGYLTSEQALADFAILIRHIKVTFPGAKNSPVIAMGGSYGGMLAAWLRMKYPNVVIGSLAASAPILQFQGLTPCEDFYRIVTDDFNRDGGKPCTDSIRKSWDIIKKLKPTESGRRILSKVFRLCSPLQSEDNVTVLEDWLSETWVNLAMVDYPYAASFLEPLPAWPIKVTCSKLQNEDLPDIALLGAIADAVGVYYNSTGKTKCFNTSQQAVSSLGDKGWYFQACSEMVMPLCTDGKNDMFYPQKWDFESYAKGCQESQKVTPLQYWVETEYGGRSLEAHSNIIFSNGRLDPWYAGGVTTSVSSSLVAVIIEDGAHHLDLRHKNKNDTPSVIRAREIEKHYLHEWIATYNENDTKKVLF